MRPVGFLLVLSAIAAAACTGTARPGDGATGTAAAEAALPQVELARLDGGGALRIADLRGRPAVINFWATTCPHCVEEMPDIEEVHRALADEVTFVGVDRADDHAKAQRLAAGTGVTYELVTDPDERFFYATSLRDVMPTTLFVDAAGVVVHRKYGPMDADELRALIREHLGIDATETG